MIPAAEWAKWIDTGRITEQRLLKLVDKIRTGEILTIQEQSMYMYHATEVEQLLRKK